MKNDAQLAQWYLERGSDQRWLMWYLLFMIPVPPLAIVFLPIAIYNWISGTRKRRIGKAMNKAAGRENYERPPGVHNRFMPMRNRPDARFEGVPATPPTAA